MPKTIEKVNSRKIIEIFIFVLKQNEIILSLDFFPLYIFNNKEKMPILVKKIYDC